MSKFLDVAIDAVKSGGAIALNYWTSGVAVEKKSDGSPVTLADKETEQTIRRIISEHYPEHAFLGEEFGRSGESEYTWVIDPIDGTRHFVRGMNGWGCQVALLKGEELVVATAFLPLDGTVIAAEKGAGCFINDQRAEVSDRPLETAYIIVENLTCLFTSGVYERLPPLIKAADYVAGKPMRLGFKYFLEGKGDAIITAGVKPWDILPWALMGREAGAKVTDIGGKEITSKSTSLLMAHQELHDAILSLLT